MVFSGDISGFIGEAVAVVALMWTVYQQYAINKMCSACPFRTGELPKIEKAKNGAIGRSVDD